MRFWITVAIGIIVGTAVTTAVYVLSPDLKAPVEKKKKRLEVPSDSPAIRVPEVHKEFVNLRQHEDHVAVFEVHNDGKSAAKLFPDKPSCTCTSALLQKGDGPEVDSMTLEPGESCKYTVRWNTRGALGRQPIFAPLLTSDPRRPRIQIQVTFTVRRDFELSPPEPNFGLVAEGQTATKSVLVYSTVLDDFRVLEAHTSAEWLHAAVEPASEEELTKVSAKSGSRLELKLEGAIPVGFLQDEVYFTTNVDESRKNSFAVAGKVEGSMRAIPSTLHFQVIRTGSDRLRRVEIFAGSLPPDRSLKVVQIEPNFIQATLRQSTNPDEPSHWQLTLEVPEQAPPGEFSGMVQIGDDEGVPRINIPISGTIDGSDRLTQAVVR